MTDTKPITALTLVDREHGGESNRLDAKIKADGDLSLEGYYAGPMCEKFFGDSDYEFWLTIPAAYKDTILLHLLKERFDSAQSMGAWLKELDIPSTYAGY